jgi:hypothetical protein
VFYCTVFNGSNTCYSCTSCTFFSADAHEFYQAQDEIWFDIEQVEHRALEVMACVCHMITRSRDTSSDVVTRLQAEGASICV